jgi:hypothetical protein
MKIRLMAQNLRDGGNMRFNLSAFTLMGPMILAASLGLVGSSSDAQEADAGTPAETSPATSSGSSSAPETDQLENPTTMSGTRPLPAPASAVSASTSRLSMLMARVKSPNLKFGLYSQTDFMRNAVNDGELDNGAPPKCFNYVNVSYALTPTRSLTVRQEFTYAFAAPRAGVKGDSKAKINDIFIAFNDTALASFGNDGSLSGIYRVYLPTGEDSRMTGRQGMFMAIFDANKPYGKLEYDAVLMSIYHNQTKNSYTTINDKGESKINANSDIDIYPYGQLTYNFNSMFQFWQTVGIWNSWLRGIPEAGVKYNQSVELESAIAYKPVPEITLTGSIYNSAPTRETPNNFALYRDAETLYRFAFKAAL